MSENTETDNSAQETLTTRLFLLEDEFPFVEDEDGNITGSGHQDPEKFAAYVNTYDKNFVAPIGYDHVLISPEDVSHQWVTFDEGDEIMTLCDKDTPGATPVTTVWGIR